MECLGTFCAQFRHPSSPSSGPGHATPAAVEAQPCTPGAAEAPRRDPTPYFVEYGAGCSGCSGCSGCILFCFHMFPRFFSKVDHETVPATRKKHSLDGRRVDVARGSEGNNEHFVDDDSLYVSHMHFWLMVSNLLCSMYSGMFDRLQIHQRISQVGDHDVHVSEGEMFSAAS